MRKAGAMASPSPASQGNKRTRRSSARKLAEVADGSTPARAASSGASGTSASGKGKRRRPATQDFPWSFPRLDRATVPPPDRRRATVGVERRAEAKSSPSSELSSGGDDGGGRGGGGRYTPELLRLSARDVAVACAGSGVLAPVSASRLDELFFGGSFTDEATSTSDGEGVVESIYRAAGVQGAGRSRGETSPTPSVGGVRGAIADCGLFEDLAPLSASLHSPGRAAAVASPLDLAAAEAIAEAEAGEKAEAEPRAESEAKAKEGPNTADAGSPSLAMPAASAETSRCAETPPFKETPPHDETPLCGETPPCREEQQTAAKIPGDRHRTADGGRTEGSWPSSVGSSSRRSLRRGTRRAAAVSAVEDIRLQTAGGEAGRGTAGTWVDVQGGRRRRGGCDQGDSGGGRGGGGGGGGGGDSASSSSVQETPSPQVCALETPPSSPSEHRRSSSSSGPPLALSASAAASATASYETGFTAASPPAVARSTRLCGGPAPTEFYVAVPETQPPPSPPSARRGERGMATRRTRSGKKPRGSHTVISQTPSPSPRTLRSHQTTPEIRRVTAEAGGSRQRSLPSLSPAPSPMDATRPPVAGEGPLGVGVAAAVAAAVTAVAAPVATPASAAAAAAAIEAATKAETEATAVVAAVVAAAPEGRETHAGSPRVGSDPEKGGAPVAAVPEGNEEFGGSSRVEGGQDEKEEKLRLILDAPRSPPAGKEGERPTGLSEASPPLAVTTTPVAATVAAAAVATVSGHCLPPSPPSPLPPPPVLTGDDRGASAADDPCRDPDQERGRALARNGNEAEPHASAAGGGDGGVDACAAARSEDPALPDADALTAHPPSPGPARGGTAPDIAYRREPASSVREIGQEKVRATEAASDSQVATVDVLGGADEMTVTPARPQQLAGNFDVAYAEVSGVAEVVDDVVIAGEDSQPDPGEYGEETPSSGAPFDYSPAGCSQVSDGGEANQGVTAAEMLVSFRRNLRPELPATPTPPSTLAAPTPAGPALSPARESLPPAKPRVTPRVPNPYDTGAGRLLTPRARAGKAKPRPASPFTLAASAAAASRQARASKAKPRPASPFALAASAAAARREAAVAAASVARARAAGMASAKPAQPATTPRPDPSSAGASAPASAVRLDKRHPIRPGGSGSGGALHLERAAPAAGETRKGSADRGALTTAQQAHASLAKVGAGPLPAKDAEAHKSDLRGDGGANVCPRLSIPPADRGFQTARGRTLAVSAEALAKVEYLFNEAPTVPTGASATDSVPSAAVAGVRRDARGEKASPPPTPRETNTAASLSVSVSSTHAVQTDGVEEIAGSGKGSSSAGSGFQTARGRPVTVSAEALAKVQHLFKADTEGAVSPSAADARPRPSATGTGGIVGGDKCPSLDNASVVTLAAGDSSTGVAKHDGGKRIPSYGKGALPVGNEIPSDGKGPLSVGNGFQTARGRPLAVSDEALAKVQHLFMEGTEGTASPSAADADPRLSAAKAKGAVGGGKCRPPTLAKAEVDNLAVDSSSTRVVKGDGGKKSPSHGKGPPSAGNGFQTARGRPLTVSDEALAKVQHLFKDQPAEESAAVAIRSPTDSQPRLPAITGVRGDSGINKLSTTLGKTNTTAGRSDTRAAGDDGGKRLPSYGHGPPLAGKGFQTARGRPLAVSDEALAKVQHLFKETSEGEASRTAVAAATGLSMEASLGRQDVNETLPATSREMDVDTPAAGDADQEASGKGRAKGEASDCPMGFHSAGLAVGGGAGFQTGRGRAILVSSEALAKVRHIFCDNGDDGKDRGIDNTSGRSFEMRAPQPPGYPQHSHAKPAGSAFRSPAVAKTFHARGTGCGGASAKGGLKRAVPLENPAIAEEGGAGSKTALTRDCGGKRPGQEPGVSGDVPGAGATFETAEGRELHVSEEAMAQTKKMVSDVGNDLSSSVVPPTALVPEKSANPAATPVALPTARAREKRGGLCFSAANQENAEVAMPPSAATGSASARDRVGGGRSEVSSGTGVGVSERSVGGDYVAATATAIETATAGFQSKRGPCGSDVKACLETTGDGGACQFSKGRASTESAEEIGEANHDFADSKAGRSSGHRGPDGSLSPRACAEAGGGGGFRTARGRALTVSAEALAKIGHLFDNDEPGDGSGASAVPPASGRKGPVAGRVGTPKESGAADDGSCVAGAGAGSVGGREKGIVTKTAAPAPPREPLKSGKPDLASGGGSGSGGNDCSNPSMFSTGGGKTIEVSAEALARVQRMFPESERLAEPVQTQQPPLKSDNPFLGVGDGDGGGSSSGNGRSSANLFSTGGGKAIEVSADALSRVRNMFTESERLAEPAQTQQRPLESSTSYLAVGSAGSGGGGSGSGGGGSSGTGRSSATLFSTGGGKAIEISAEALARVDNMFSESERLVKPVQTQQPPLNSSSPYLAGGGADSSSGGDGGAGGVGGGGRFKGSLFSTGGGKVIEVSAEALSRVENMFAESERLVEPARNQQRPPLADGSSKGSLFSTGGGKAIEVSAEALSRVENMFAESERLVGPEQNQQRPPLADGSSNDGAPRNRVTSCGDGVSFPTGGTEQGRESGELESSGEQERFGVDKDGNGCGSSGSSNRSISSTVSGRDGSANVFSTGGGRRVEVSAEALARAQKMLGEADPYPADNTMNSPHPTLRGGAGGAGGSGGSGGGGWGDSRSAGTGRGVGGSTLTLRRPARGASREDNGMVDRTAIASPAPLQLRQGVAGERIAAVGVLADSPHSLPLRLETGSPAKRGCAPRTGGLPLGFGKENAQEEQRESPLVNAPVRRTGAWGASPLAGCSPMSTRQRSMSTPVREAATGGKSPATGSRAVFSPPKRTSSMPPPAGVSTPSSSLKKPLVRLSTPAGASAPSLIGRVTPQPARGRGVVGSVSSGGGLHATKRPRSASVLPGSAKRRGVAGRGAFPRPSPGRQGVMTAVTSPRVTSASLGRSGGSGGSSGADHGGEGSTRAATAPSGLAASLPELGCRASRVLFGSLGAVDAGAAGMEQQERRSPRRRRPLSSLLNEHTQVSETLPLAGGGCDSLPADGPAKPAEATAMVAAAPDVVATGAGRVAECGSAGEQQIPLVGRGAQTAGEAAALLRAVVTEEERGGIIAALLGRVTAANACDLRFLDVDDGDDDDDSGDLSSSGGGSGDGRPCCFSAPAGGTTACASKLATGGAAVAGGEQGAGGSGCGRHGRAAQVPGTTRFRDELLRGGGDGQLASPTWVENHVRWIVWKLAATERRFPEHFPSGYLTAGRVARQLRYRYDVELDRAKKPCLKAVLQGDASASRPMVLCVSRMYGPDDLGARRGAAAAVVEVTDGWYPVDASLDEALAHFLRRGKIVPGTKLSLSNATLEAGGDASSSSSGGDGSGGVPGADPLELLRRRGAGELPPGAGPRLRLVVNSTRRARWDARLGFFRPKREHQRGRGGGGQADGGGGGVDNRGVGSSSGRGRGGASCAGSAEAARERSALEVPLCTVVPGGGIVTATRVLILRRYPAVYISETFGGNGEGSRGGGGGGGGGTGGGGAGGAPRRVLSEAEEEGERALHQAKLQRAIEAAASGMEEEVMAEMEESTPDSFRRMKEAENPSTFFDSLDTDDQKEVSEWRDRHQQVVEGLRQKAMDERLRNMDGVDRRVRQLITLRVACVCAHAGDSSRGGSGVGGAEGCGSVSGKGPQRSARRHALPPMVAVLKLWGANEATAALLAEGAELRLHGVTASSCHHHVPGCSLELSAGRQTKIEVLRAPSPSKPTPRRMGVDPTVDASRPIRGRRGEPTSNLRFSPRRHTSLLAFESPPTPPTVGSASGFGGRVGRKATPTRFGAPPVVRDAAEVDFVGCVFAVTREFPSPTGVREAFASADSVSSSALSGARGSDSGGAEAHRSVGAGRGATGEIAREAEARGQPRDANSDVVPETVTYHVYLTEPSGACLRLKKQIRTELARHHRILRSAPGTCWAVVNAGLATTSSDALGGRGGAGGDVLAFGDRTLSCSGEGGTRGVPTVCWSSVTAVGGSGNAPPPRRIGGAPTGHLEQPLLALRRWTEGDGRAAVRRERQRLAVLLDRETHAVASAPVALHLPAPALLPRGGGGGGGGGEGKPSANAGPRGGEGVNDSRDTRALAVPAQGRETPERAHNLIGFVSSFSVLAPSCADRGGDVRGAPRAEVFRTAATENAAGGVGSSSRRDDATLWLHIDTGERMLAVWLPQRALRQLLGLTLDHNGRSSATCLPSVAVGAPGGSPRREELPRRLSNAHGLLRAVAALGFDTTREEHIGGTGDGCENAMGTSSATLTTGVAKQATALAEQPVSPTGNFVAVPENAADDAGNTVQSGEQAAPSGDPETDRAVEGANDPAAAAASREDAVDALTASLFRMARECRHSSGLLFSDACCPTASGSVGAAPVALRVASSRAGAHNASGGLSVGLEKAGEPTELIAPAPTVDGDISVDDAPGRVSRVPSACGTEDVSTVGLGGGAGATKKRHYGASVASPVSRPGRAGSLLGDLALACGRKQLEFSVLRSFSKVLGREVGVVNGVRPVDAIRSAQNLLEDLVGSCALP